MIDIGRLIFPLHSEQQRTFERRLVPGEEFYGPCMWREETDDELRERIKHALAHELGPS